MAFGQEFDWLAMSHLSLVTDAEITRSREDPRFKQILLAKSLEGLLSKLHKLQNSARGGGAVRPQELREGAIMAAQLADRIRALDDQIRLAAEP